MSAEIVAGLKQLKLNGMASCYPELLAKSRHAGFSGAPTILRRPGLMFTGDGSGRAGSALITRYAQDRTTTRLHASTF